MTREELINHIRYAIDIGADITLTNEDGEEIIRALEQEPKTGHWVDGEYCSECGCDIPAYIIDWKWQKDMDAHYCPMCGAKMESEG